MRRIISIAVLIMLLAPWFSPLAKASSCGEVCPLGSRHECAHGDTCPMHLKKKHGDSAHNDGQELICHVGKNADEGNASAGKDVCGVSFKCDGNKDFAGVPAHLADPEYVTTSISFVQARNSGIFKDQATRYYQDPQSSLLDRPPATL